MSILICRKYARWQKIAFEQVCRQTIYKQYIIMIVSWLLQTTLNDIPTSVIWLICLKFALKIHGSALVASNISPLPPAQTFYGPLVTFYTLLDQIQIIPIEFSSFNVTETVGFTGRQQKEISLKISKAHQIYSHMFYKEILTNISIFKKF